MTNKKLLLSVSFAAICGLAGCNYHGTQSKQDFGSAGQQLGNGNVGTGAADTGAGFARGAQATGQAIGQGTEDTGQAIKHAVNGD